MDLETERIGLSAINANYSATTVDCAPNRGNFVGNVVGGGI